MFLAWRQYEVWWYCSSLHAAGKLSGEKLQVAEQTPKVPVPLGGDEDLLVIFSPSHITRMVPVVCVTIVENVTLDGVYQAPAGADEDTRGGFTKGGWAAPYSDETMLRELGVGSGPLSDLLFGRRTYEHFASVWPHMPQPNPFTDILNNSQKWVASRTLGEPLEWMHSTVLDGSAGEAVGALKQSPGPDIVVLGSGELVQTLLRHGLVDEIKLSIHPLVLGTGRRLFRDGSALGAFTLVKAVPTPKGVVIATYRPG